MVAKKQAVVVIHGIGEQRPMSTLRKLVYALVGDEYKSKPDRLSESFELRRLNYDVKKTDTHIHFYEYYWAYRMRDNRYQHVFDWLARMLWPPIVRWCDAKNVPLQNPRLRPLLRNIWILLVFFMIVTFLIVLKFSAIIALFTIVSVSLIFLIVSRLIRAVISRFVLDWVGDAARYLNSAPLNVAERQAIIGDGLALLRKLHKDGYDRIVILGHSLGSVIGYDILKHYWAEVNHQLPINPGSVAFEKLMKVEMKCGCPENFQECQLNLWEQLEVRDKETKPKWSISDFVTLGSPLSYGAFLLAESSEDFTKRTKQRELPVCPPTQNGGNERPDGYAYPDDDNDCLLFLHHAAHFAVTRWTNFYFKGDPIGGKVHKVFGKGILDVALEDDIKWLKIRSHIRYWTINGKKNDCVIKLQEMLDLVPGKKLEGASRPVSS